MSEIYQNLLASATLVDFQQFRDIHHLIPQALDPSYPSMEPHCPQIEDPDKWEIYVKYRKILSQFLIDQNDDHNSSLHFWSIGRQERYFSLAKYLLGFLKGW